MESNAASRVPVKMTTGGVAGSPPPLLAAPSVSGPIQGPPGAAGPMAMPGMEQPGNEQLPMFVKRMCDIVDGGFLTLSLAAGYQTGLFDALLNYEGTPRTSHEIAADTGLKERYVREWLAAMVTGNIVDQDDEDRFLLPPHRAAFLQNGLGKQLLILASALPMQGKVFNKVMACFQKDGPSGVSYDHYKEFHHFMSMLSDSWWDQHLMKTFLPCVPGLEEQLESGISVLDVGCGEGGVSIMLAERFPKSKFLCIDLVEAPIKDALVAKAEKKLDNIDFRVMDAHNIPVEAWSESFEFVMACDALHDMAHPTEVVRIIKKILKPGGRLSVLEVHAHSDMRQNKAMPHASTFYTNSLFHCMTVSLHAEGSEGKGNMWGLESTEMSLKEGGLKVLAVHQVEEWFNAHYLCQKS